VGCSTAASPDASSSSSSTAADAMIAQSNLISGRDQVTAHREGWNN
jgi:hypothetical protein